MNLKFFTLPLGVVLVVYVLPLSYHALIIDRLLAVSAANGSVAPNLTDRKSKKWLKRRTQIWKKYQILLLFDLRLLELGKLLL
jgi:hypothetical protein